MFWVIDFNDFAEFIISFVVPSLWWIISLIIFSFYEMKYKNSGISSFCF